MLCVLIVSLSSSVCVARIDPTGEFCVDNKRCFGSDRSVEANIRKEFDVVAKETAAKFEKLQTATDAHAGLEMLHLFVLDLLGRDTSAAIIFKTKTDEE